MNFANEKPTEEVGILPLSYKRHVTGVNNSRLSDIFKEFTLKTSKKPTLH